MSHRDFAPYLSFIMSGIASNSDTNLNSTTNSNNVEIIVDTSAQITDEQLFFLKKKTKGISTLNR